VFWRPFSPEGAVRARCFHPPGKRFRSNAIIDGLRIACIKHAELRAGDWICAYRMTMLCQDYGVPGSTD
jgi:hypothetical protein